MMRCADGVELATDIYRPDTPGPHPVLMMRQPYGRRIASAVVFAHPAWYAAHGYIVAIQDSRGRGDSGGTFRLFANDVDDGATALDWAADLPGASGKVGLYGFSYQGTSQFLAMAGARTRGGKRPDAIAPTMAAWNIRDDWAYEGGAFRLAGNIGWACQMGAEQARLAGDAVAFAALAAAGRGAPVGGATPALPDALVRYAHYTHYQDWLNDDPAYWATIAPSAHLREDALDIPALHIGGWQDTMLGGTLASHAAFTAGGAPQRLLIGPWQHMPWGRNVGALDLGAEAASCIDAEQIAFFDAHLRGIGEPPSGVRLFDIGRKAWEDFASLPQTRDVVFHLGSNGLAAATPDDGVLAAEPGHKGVDWLLHDPWRPAPAIGGATGQPGGFQNRAAIDDRGDVAVYTTSPLTAPLTLFGEIAVELDVDCDQPTHDLYCTLSQVSPDGRAITLTTGFLRVTDRSIPGPRRNALQATFCTVPQGAALRLSVQAAAWPAFMINPGKSVPLPDTRLMDCAVTTVRILHGGDRKSRVVLPLLLP
ncbi:CocE/NonD family hydrolase [Pseudorhodoplanes sinuspersici]|nr:CocE/NonD family hydrolase [Pseudorhodoplanes sinuspersici]